MINSNDKGAMAEMHIAALAADLGIRVSKPLWDGGRYDLIFDMRPDLLRVQCKWAVRSGDVVRVWLRSSRHTPSGYVTATYSEHEVDAVAAWCAALARCYLIPVALLAGQCGIHLRLAPARNNQRSGIHSAAQYELGAIAQLGERHAGSVEAVGSSPTSSTITS